MNNWQFKFRQIWLLILAKIKMNARSIKIIGSIFGIILILLVLVAIILYFNFYFNKDRMIRYVPGEAILYASFNTARFNDQGFIENILTALKQKYGLANLDTNILNKWVGENMALAIIPKSDDDFYNFDYLIFFDLSKKPDEAWLSAQNLNYAYLENDFLNKNILVLASSADAITKVISVRNQEENSLAQSLGVSMNLDKLKPNIGKMYVNLEKLASHYSQLTDLRFKLLLLSLREGKAADLYLGINSAGRKIVLSNFGSNNFSRQALLANVPADFFYNLEFESGSNKLIKTLNSLNSLAPDFYSQIFKNMEYSKGILNMDWQNDILPLFNQRTQIVSYPGNKYLVATEIERVADLPAKLSKLEEIVINAFAVEGSKEVQKRLVDGTYITQIFRTANQQFENAGEDNKTRVLSNSKIEFGYYISGKRLILSNSLELLNNLGSGMGLVSADVDKIANLSTNITISDKLLSYYGDFSGLINSLNLGEQSGLFSLILE
ncbi:MAG: hypothetical protein PHC97_00120 [Patescibacteria group bacterium]|nr:hypothetical protein [Patescibacteria group bacterium]